MKKLIALMMALVMVLGMVGCGGSTQEPPKEIELTKSNILDYVQFDGEFTNWKYTSIYTGLVGTAEATLEFQAYPVASGKFNNVSITLVATSDDSSFTYGNRYGNYWHLSDADGDTNEIKIDFMLGIDGRFSKNYSVECSNNNSGKLNGSCDFTIISVSGTFIPD